MYGPVPTGLGSANVAGSCFDQMCAGTMNVWPMRNRLAYCGWLNVSTAWPGLGAVALTGTGVPSVASPFAVLIMLKVKATSLAPNGFPSLQRTPCRMLSVRVLPPFDQLSPVASRWYGG